MGSAGEAMFFGVLLLFGLIGLIVLLSLPSPRQWQVNHDFLRTTCRVLEADVAEREVEDGVLFRAEIQIEYEVDGVVYKRRTRDIDTADDLDGSFSQQQEDQRKLLVAFVVGKEYPCWYDPDQPGTVVLVRESSWWVWLIYSIPLSFLLVGGGGFLYRVLHWGKSTEHRAAMARRAQELDPFATNGRSSREYPNVPDGADLTNSPGTTLRFRLPIDISPGWALFGTLVACVFWNGIVAFFSFYAISGYIEGKPDWLLTLFLIPFILIGVGLIYAFVRQMLVTTGIGPTLVEVSDHPLHPGGSCRLFVSQSGRLVVNRFEVLLVCDEAATYRQGTNTRRETCRIQEHRVFSREGFDVTHGVPFETEFELSVPLGAMHSFKADHNEVNWKVLIRGDVDGWPDYERVFPFVVRPRNEGTRP